MLTKIVLPIHIIVFTVFIVSCSGTGSIISSGPSDSDAKTAIEKAVTTAMTNRIIELPLWQDTEQVKVNSVSILRRGEYNDTAKYYPIQAKADGSFVQKSLDGGRYSGLGASRNCTFSNTGDFRLSKNDYGEWVVQIVRNTETDKDSKMICDK